MADGARFCPARITRWIAPIGGFQLPELSRFRSSLLGIDLSGADTPADDLNVTDEKANQGDYVTFQNNTPPGSAVLPNGTEIRYSGIRAHFPDHTGIDDAGLPEPQLFVSPDLAFKEQGFFLSFNPGGTAPGPYTTIYGEITAARLLSPVPLPASGWFLMAALGAACLGRRFRRQ